MCITPSEEKQFLQISKIRTSWIYQAVYILLSKYVANPHVYTNTHTVSFAHVARYLFIQGEGKTVVEEEELTMGKQSVQQCVHAITFQQHLKITAREKMGSIK